jgi:hypothetical protein
MRTQDPRAIGGNPARFTVPFAIRRPILLARGAMTDRRRPDLDRLSQIQDPEQFVWAILPHAARTFATSILMLPASQARAAAVAYLYCRMLDTYEDLTDPDDTEAALTAFAARVETGNAPPPVPLATRDAADRSYALLIEKCDLVDQVFESLPVQDRRRIVALVRAMADGMVWSARRFKEQGGVLIGMEQVSRYCHHVIGEPVLFAMELVSTPQVVAEHRSDALAVSELIQLANITRDVERDLQRGIGYDASLRPYLGSDDAAGPVRVARKSLMAQALPHVSAYTRLFRSVATKRFSLARASAIVMLLHTDRHYSQCARLAGEPGWRAGGGGLSVFIHGAISSFSQRWAERVMTRVETDFLGASEALTNV